MTSIASYLSFFLSLVRGKSNTIYYAFSPIILPFVGNECKTIIASYFHYFLSFEDKCKTSTSSCLLFLTFFHSVQG